MTPVRPLVKSVVLALTALAPVAIVTTLLAPPRALAQACDYASPSLSPDSAFQPAEATYQGYALRPALIAPSVIAVNSANQFQYATSALPGFTQFNGATFPPAGTGTLPRLFAASPLDIASFYLNAGSYTSAQLQAVQRLYAMDLASRRNYGTNLANLARDFTALRKLPGLQPLHLSYLDDSLLALRQAYDALSDPARPAPSPRTLYRRVGLNSAVLFYVFNPGIPPARFSQTLNILAIGISNYDTNRVPVPGGSNEPAPTACSGCYPFPSFDTVRNQPLAPAQSNPAGVFGPSVQALLARFGLRPAVLSAPQSQGGSFSYQVNSANQLQFVGAATRLPGSLRLFVGGSFPTITPDTLPKLAFAGNADGYLRSADALPDTQRRLAVLYADPANAGRRANYGRNLQNLGCAFRQLAADSRLPAAARPAVQGAITRLDADLATLNRGGLPEVFGLYRFLNTQVSAVFATLPFGAREAASPFATRIASLRTIDNSLVPIGVINYYLTPILLLP
jgi:hypothetical protein